MAYIITTYITNYTRRTHDIIVKSHDGHMTDVSLTPGSLMVLKYNSHMTGTSICDVVVIISL